MTVGKFVGCVMMVVGSAIGAGIVAMPMACAFAGFTATVVMMLFLWILQTVTGLLVLEVTLSLPDNACSFNSMAQSTLGPIGKVIIWIAYLLLLYTTLAAYIAGEPDQIIGLLRAGTFMKVPHWLVTTLFTVILGSAVYCSTKATDFVNRGLISVKGFLLITTIVLFLAYINPSQLLVTPNIHQIRHVLVASPVLLTLFNYHFVIPSIRMYVGKKPQVLKWIIITGTTTCLVVYLFWLAPILSKISMDGKDGFSAIGGSTGELARVLTTIATNDFVKLCIHGFTNITMTTAFLGVALGLFDFLADGFKRPNTKVGRLQTACLTFFPPLLVNVLLSDPNGFLRYFSWSGIFVAVLFLVLPPIMVTRIRKNPQLMSVSPYHVSLGKISFAIITIVGVFFTVFPLLLQWGLFAVE